MADVNINQVISIVLSIFFKSIFSILYPKVDAYCYAGIFEGIIKKYPHNKSGYKFWRWLFTEKDLIGFKNAVPYYRVFQKLILISFWLVVYIKFYSIFPFWLFIVDAVCGVLWAYYWMKYERSYYYYADQEKEMYAFQLNNEDVYWLKRIYFSGYWLFSKGFTGWKFDLSSAIGTIGLFITSFSFTIYFVMKGV